MSIPETTFDQIYDDLESRLDQTGVITLSEAYEISGVGYSVASIVFREIMETMIEQGKAEKITNGKYRILKPNNRRR